MRTATKETIAALREAIGDEPYSRWARRVGLSKIDVHHALSRTSMSAERENRIRSVLLLPPLRWRTVEIADNQRIVTITPPRNKVRRAVWLEPEECERMERRARSKGYSSLGAYMRAQMLYELECSGW